MSLKTAAALALGFLAGGVGAYSLHDTLAPPAERGGVVKTSAAPRERINALGRLQPAGGVVAVYAPPGDRVETLEVKQGQRVTKGTVLARLASRKERQMELTLAEKQLDEARRQKAAIRRAGEANVAVIDSEIKALRAGCEPDIDAQRARIRVLEAQQAQAQLQLNRLRGLDPHKAEAPTQEVEKAQLLLAQLKGELEGAHALLRKTEVTYQSNEEALQRKRAAAEAEQARALDQVPEQSLEQGVALARRRVELTEVTAPVDGTVLKLIAREGHATGTQPVLEMSGGSGMVVVVEVYETDVGRLNEWLAKGPVDLELSSEAVPPPLRARLSDREQVTRMIARNALLSLNPRADADRRVVEVRGDLDADSARRAARLVGLQVDVLMTPQP